jgi:hypothetical protein
MEEIWATLQSRYGQAVKRILRDEKMSGQNFVFLVSTLALDEKLKLTEGLAQFESNVPQNFKEVEINRFFLSKFLEFKWPEYFQLKNHLIELFS